MRAWTRTGACVRSESGGCQWLLELAVDSHVIFNTRPVCKEQATAFHRARDVARAKCPWHISVKLKACWRKKSDKSDTALSEIVATRFFFVD